MKIFKVIMIIYFFVKLEYYIIYVKKLIRLSSEITKFAGELEPDADGSTSDS